MVENLDMFPESGTTSATTPAPTLVEMGKGLFDQENASNFFQFLKGPSLIGAAMLFGMPGIIATGIFLLGVGAQRTRGRTANAKLHMVQQYKHELAALAHKKPAEVTVTDLEITVADMKQRGIKNALTLELDAINEHYRVNQISGTLTTIAMTVLTAFAFSEFAASLFKGAASFALAGANSAVGKMVYDTVRSGVTSVVTGNPAYYSISREIENIRQQAKFSEVKPERVLYVFTKTDPALAEHIKTRYGSNFSNLPLRTKQHIVERMEDTYHAKALADAINRQEILPTELGFIAYGQRSGHVPKISFAKQEETQAAPSSNDMPPAMQMDGARLVQFIQTLLNERQKEKQQKESPVIRLQ